MATTTNYGWTTPDNTDLVKNGAAAIRTLGSAIDTSMNTALGTKKAGMVLLNTTSFSGVASTSLAANTFTSSYTNYKILMKTTNSAAGELYFRYRASGTDNTNANYNHGYFDATGITASRTNNSTYNYIGYQELNGKHFYDLDIYSPQETEYSAHKCAENRNHSGNNPLLFLTYGDFGATTSFDSITIYPQFGNITGTYSVYGVNK